MIRHYLKKDYSSKPSYQYNAIMLVRILVDNPGQTFTRNLDEKFVKTVKDVLKTNDPSVHQMMTETLETFENTRAYDEGLTPLITMWQQEKKNIEKDAQKRFGVRTTSWTEGDLADYTNRRGINKGRATIQRQQPPQPHAPEPRTLNAPPFDAHSQNYFARSHSSRRLPDPVELASRLEEARTSATLLHQVVSSTPPGEVLQNELIREFADRCTSASRSIQGYMAARDPAPDNDTMESLIDTNEQLQASLSLHQRAMLNARKQAEIGSWSEEVSSAAAAAADGQSAEDPHANGGNGGPPPPLPSRSAKPKAAAAAANGKGKEREYERSAAAAGPSGSRSHTPPTDEEDNPFRDPEADSLAPGRPSGSGARPAASGGVGSAPPVIEEPRLAFEPFHPGFGGSTTTAAGKAEAAPPPLPAKDHERDSDSDIYDAEASKQKEPMYRY